MIHLTGVCTPTLSLFRPVSDGPWFTIWDIQYTEFDEMDWGFNVSTQFMI